MGYITPEFANVGQALKVKMFDELWNAVVVEDSPYDSKNINIRIDST
jgi:dimethylglycine dehydrogenase